jgi:hypothetical protein
LETDTLLMSREERGVEKEVSRKEEDISSASGGLEWGIPTDLG